MDGITTIIFDCFGLFYPVYIDTFFQQYAKLFPDRDARDALLENLNSQIDLGQITQDEFYVAIAKASGMNVQKVATEMEATKVLDNNLVEFITELKKKYKIGLLSNAGQEEIDVIYQDGLGELFDAITVSYEVGDVKPNPKIFLTSLERLHSSPTESVFIDDSLKNLVGAERVGLRTIHYPRFGEIPAELRALS